MPQGPYLGLWGISVNRVSDTLQHISGVREREPTRRKRLPFSLLFCTRKQNQKEDNIPKKSFLVKPAQASLASAASLAGGDGSNRNGRAPQDPLASEAASEHNEHQRMISGIDPKVDYVFKRLFGDEDHALLLVDLLNAVLVFAPGKVIRGVTLLNPFIARDYDAKSSIFDVRARDDPGRQFLVEMQQVLHPGFANRLLYYWSGGHGEQLHPGEHYEMLLPTYSICLLNGTLVEENTDWHHTFRVYDEEHRVSLCKDLEIHLLELSKFDGPVEQVPTPLERWCYFFKHGASLDPDALPATLDNPLIRQAVEVLVKISQSEYERQRYLERQRAEQFAASRAAQEKMARQLGYAEGHDEGMEKGRAVGRIQLLQQLLGQPETSSAELDQLPEEKLLQLEDSLRQQLSSKKQVNGAGPPDRP